MLTYRDEGVFDQMAASHANLEERIETNATEDAMDEGRMPLTIHLHFVFDV